jgi:hypothetical protein
VKFVIPSLLDAEISFIALKPIDLLVVYGSEHCTENIGGDR